MVASVTVPWLQCAATAMTFGFSIGALAQDDTVSFLEEIIVTARRREENLQTVPLSVIAFPEQEIHLAGIQEIEDLNVLVPNAVFTGRARQGDARGRLLILERFARLI